MADLLDRFEAAIVETLEALDVTPHRCHEPEHRGRRHHPARRRVRLPRTWCGQVVSCRTRCTAWRVSRPSRWCPTPRTPRCWRCPLSRGTCACAVDLSGVASGRLPVITEYAATDATGALLAAHRGRDPARGRRRRYGGSVHATWSPDLVADHIGVTSPGAHPPRRRRRRPAGAGRPRRARGTRLAGGVRVHRPGRGTPRPGAPGPPHHRGHAADRDHRAAASRPPAPASWTPRPVR